jgi:hypothetical protein
MIQLNYFELDSFVSLCLSFIDAKILITLSNIIDSDLKIITLLICSIAVVLPLIFYSLSGQTGKIVRRAGK